jgi:hypothetical protein
MFGKKHQNSNPYERFQKRKQELDMREELSREKLLQHINQWSNRCESVILEANFICFLKARGERNLLRSRESERRTQMLQDKRTLSAERDEDFRESLRQVSQSLHFNWLRNLRKRELKLKIH